MVSGIPWRSSEYNSALSLLRAWARSLVRELGSHRLHRVAKPVPSDYGLMKRFSTLLAFREMQIKSTVGHPFTTMRMAGIERQTVTSIGQGVERGKPCALLARMEIRQLIGKRGFYTTQQFYSWVSAQEKWECSSTQNPEHQCSQHDSQQPKGGNHPNVISSTNKQINKTGFPPHTGASFSHGKEKP